MMLTFHMVHPLRFSAVFDMIKNGYRKLKKMETPLSPNSADWHTTS